MADEFPCGDLGQQRVEVLPRHPQIQLRPGLGLAVDGLGVECFGQAQVVVIEVQRVDQVVILAEADAQPPSQQFLQQGRGEDVVGKAQPRVLAAHRGEHDQPPGPDVEAIAQGARNIAVAGEITSGVEQLDHRLPRLVVVFQQPPHRVQLIPSLPVP